MSLLSPRVRIALTPGRVALANGGGYHDAVVATPGWAGALEALAELVSVHRATGRAGVTLSQHFAGVHLLPPPPVVLKTGEQAAWVRDALAHQHGEACRDWRLAWQAEPPGQPFVVASLAADRFAALEAFARTASLRLASVQPWLVAACRRQRVGRAPAWLALAEPGRVTLAALRGGYLQRLRSVRVQGEAAPALADLLAREALLAGETAPAPLWVDSVLPEADWRSAFGGRVVQRLPAGREALDAMLKD